MVRPVTIIVSLVAVLGLLFCFIWLARTKLEAVIPTVVEGQQERDQTAIKLVEPVVVKEKTVTPDSSSNSDVRRAKAAQANTDSVERVDNAPDAVDLIQQASTGNLDAAVEFLNKLRKCKSAGSMKSKASVMSDLMEQTSIETGAEIPASLSRDAWLNRAEDAEADCLHFLVGEDGNIEGAANNLIDNLKEKASTGNSMLRFMYSMWGPENRASVLSTRTVLEYEDRSREFTELNLMENPKLALLALGISYSEGNFFTPLRLPLGRAYLWAAGICGIDQSVVDSFLERYSRVLSVQERFGQVELVGELEVLELSTNIADTACPINFDN